MKKIKFIYVLLFVLLANFSFAQSLNYDPLIKLDPKFLFGYVVLDNKLYPDVTRWEIDVMKKTYTDSVNYVYTREHSTTLNSLNYFKLSNNYLQDENGSFKLVINGFNNRGTLIAEDEYDITYNAPFNPTDYEVVDYDWNCNSHNYAWKVVAALKKINDVLTQTGNLSIEPLYSIVPGNGEAATPHYVYMTPDDYLAMTNTPQKFEAFKNFHALWHLNYSNHTDPFANNNTNLPHAYKFIRAYNINTGHGLKGYYGQTVTGDVVYGVQKTPGYWQGYVSFGSDIDNISSSWTIQGVIDVMNTYCDDIVNGTYPDLMCDGNGSAMPTPDPLPEFERSRFLECMNSVNWEQDFYLAYQQLRACILNSPKPPFKLDSIFSHATISCLSKEKGGESSNIAHIDLQNMFDAQGNAIAPRFTYEPGLYFFDFTLQNSAHVFYVTEITEQISSSLEMADYIQTSIRPVPIIGRYFIIDINSPIDTNILFELYDSNGNFLHAENLNVRSGTSSFNIYPRNLMPTGLLINVFKFSDNSISTINTRKI